MYCRNFLVKLFIKRGNFVKFVDVRLMNLSLIVLTQILNNMKKTLIFLLLTIGCLNALGQDGKEIEFTLKKYDKRSSNLKSAIGWAYNDSTEQWVDYKNVILDDISYKKTSKIYQLDKRKSQTSQNFSEMQAKSFTLDGKEYVVLIVEKLIGGLQSATKEDWEMYKVRGAYIFDKKDYDRLLDIKDSVRIETVDNIYLDVPVHTTKRRVELTELNAFEYSLKGGNIRKPYKHLFRVRKSDKGDIHFLVPYEIPVGKRKDINFDKNYFSVSPKEFSKILIK